MCSPAPVVLRGPDRLSLPPATKPSEPAQTVNHGNTVRTRLQSWLAGWKQTLIAELASLGSPREGFL
jgi:hypothetical protein